jgi:ABC-type molybdenum transport system ATPase subunit/photorepair protein PhrA
MLFRLSDATKSYGGNEILRGVSFQVNPNEKARKAPIPEMLLRPTA